jgi:hypothetical protein
MESAHTSDTNIIHPFQVDAPLEVRLSIHQQFPGIELVSPVYVSNGATCHLLPDQRVYVDSKTQVGFSINPDHEESIGALIYRLQRNNTDQPYEETTCIQLIMIWKINSSREFCVVSDLIEHDKDHIWDSIELMNRVAWYALFDMQHGPIEETWIIHGNIALITSLNVTREEECYKLEMTISETSIKDDYIQRPRYISLHR